MTANFGEEGFRWFVGVVSDILDPQQLGRVRVRIFGLHDDTSLISNEDLPWAQVLVSPTSASLAGVGITPVGLAPDSYVVGFFADGKAGQFPIIMGSFHKMPQKDPNLSDVNILARGTNKINKEKIGPEPEPAYNAQYPKNQVFESKSGHIIEIDDTDGSERIHVYHRMGTYIEIDQDGRLVIKSNNSSIDVAAADKQIYAKDNISITSDKSINITAKEDIILKGKTIKMNAENTNVSLADNVVGIFSGDVRVSGDYFKVDTPTSSISGTTLKDSKVIASQITSSKVTSGTIASATTGGLSSAMKNLTGSLSSITNLSSISDLSSLTGVLDSAFGSLTSSISGLSSNLIDDTLENVMNEVNGISKELQDAIDFDKVFEESFRSKLR